MPAKKEKSSLIRLLERLDLTENEAELYTIMLKHPHVTVQELQQLSPFPRTLLYHILNGLMARGLVNFIQKTRRTAYIAEDPQKLYDMLGDKEREFEKQKKALREAIPDLRNQYRLAHHRPGLRVFEGIEGYRASLEDIVHSRPDCVYTYMHITQKKKPGVEIRRELDKERIAWGIPERVLLFDTPEARAWLAARDSDAYTTFRLFPKKLQMFDVDLRVYAQKIAYTTFEGREPVVMMTEDPHMYTMHQHMFEYVWGTAEPIDRT